MREAVQVNLMTAHRILIGSATGVFTLYGIWQLRHETGPGSVAFGVTSLAAAVGLAAYFAYLWKRRLPGPPPTRGE